MGWWGTAKSLLLGPFLSTFGDWRNLVVGLRLTAEQITDAGDRHDYAGEQGERSKQEYDREDQRRHYARQ